MFEAITGLLLLALGGNGTGTELYQRLCNLPTRNARQTDLSEGATT